MSRCGPEGDGTAKNRGSIRTDEGNLSRGPKVDPKSKSLWEPVWAMFVEPPAAGVPRIGFLSPSTAAAMVVKKMTGSLVTRDDPAYPRAQSCAVQMPDGSWGYWTRHGDVDAGWVVLAAGRVIAGKTWDRWQQGRVLDGRFPTIWLSMDMRRAWSWQVDQDGRLTQSGI